jgi:hypothetical protein
MIVLPTLYIYGYKNGYIWGYIYIGVEWVYKYGYMIHIRVHIIYIDIYGYK